MPYEVRYSDIPQDRHLTKEEAMKKLQGLVAYGEVEELEIRFHESMPGGFFIAVFPIPGKLWDDWVTVESEDFTSHDVARNFLREANLTHLVKST